MEFLDSERGQSVQVGVILLFGFLVIALSLYQATVVPEETKSTEFEAYLDGSDDLVSLHNGILAGATQGVQSGQVVQTGSRYTPRTVFVNPAPPTGSLSLSPSRTVSITGADAVDGEADSVGATWDGRRRSYESKVLRYTPDYNEFSGAPVSLSGVSVQREAEQTVVPLGGQTLISGNRITVVSLDGEVGQTSIRTPLTVAPVSSATRTVTVTNTTGSDIELVVPVGSNATSWTRSRLVDRMATNERVVSITDLDAAADPSNSLVRVVLDGSYTYELRLAKVELSSASATSTVAPPDGEYLVPVTTGAVAPPGETTQVVVEARDRFNNPVEGEAIDFTVSGDASPASRTVTTTDEGRARFEFTVDANASDSITIDASRDFDGSGTVDSVERVTYTVPVVNGSGTGSGNSGSTSQINPPESGKDVILDSAEIRSSSQDDVVDVTLNNTGSTRTITAFRVSFYYPDQGSELATTVQLNGSSQQPIGGQQYDLGTNSVRLAADTNTPIELTFDNSNDKVSAGGDFFILTVQFDDGQFATYFVAVPKNTNTSTGPGNGNANN
jgi:hypothetical protein